MKRALAHKTAKNELDKKRLESTHQEKKVVYGCDQTKHALIIHNKDDLIKSIRSEFARLVNKASKCNKILVQEVLSLIQVQA